MNRRKVGAEYERYAAHFLEKQGYQIIEYNYCCRLGEIDIVARDGRYLVFVEVKYRSDSWKSIMAGRSQEDSVCSSSGIQVLAARSSLVSAKAEEAAAPRARQRIKLRISTPNDFLFSIA